MSASLYIDDLHAWYGAAQVVHGVNLSIGEGEAVALVGRNGSGRSTLAKAIMGLVRCEGVMRFAMRRSLTCGRFRSRVRP